MNKIDNDRMWLSFLCARDELERAVNPQCAEDYLLRVRADTILDHPRLTRLFYQLKHRAGASWTLTGAFRDDHYRTFLGHLPPADQESCAAVCFGDVFSTDPNGTAQRTAFGPLVSLCFSLTYFARFAHLALLDFGEFEVPMQVRQRALLISTRVMMKYEALDFTMDPRGIIPARVGMAIDAPIKYQLEWIAGHEFSHVLLGHLSNDRETTQRMMYGSGQAPPPAVVYSRSHQDEFDADREALLRPLYSPERRGIMRNAALLWLAAVQLYEAALDVISPPIEWRPRSHPSARERFDALTQLPINSQRHEDDWRELQELVEHHVEFLTGFLRTNIDDYETYGSVYLAEPSTEWRGPALIDRVDY